MDQNYGIHEPNNVHEPDALKVAVEIMTATTICVQHGLLSTECSVLSTMEVQWSIANVTAIVIANDTTVRKIEQRPYPDIITTASLEGLRRGNIWFRISVRHRDLYMLHEPAAIYQKVT